MDWHRLPVVMLEEQCYSKKEVELIIVGVKLMIAWILAGLELDHKNGLSCINTILGELAHLKPGVQGDTAKGPWAAVHNNSKSRSVVRQQNGLERSARQARTAKDAADAFEVLGVLFRETRDPMVGPSASESNVFEVQDEAGIMAKCFINSENVQ
ncbi:hypothetical protein BGX28_002458 [Mortierella sp. GBA30]|nr:hypothetical protein BGX28_002458 [Mortierella sp. GBA30]